MLMAPTISNPILERSRQDFLHGWLNAEKGTTVSKDKHKTKDQAIAEEAGVAGIPDEVVLDAQARTSASLNPEFYALPGCGACGGITAHRQTCAAYDANNVMTMSGGWCTPSEAIYAAAGETIPESVRDHAPGDDGRLPEEEEEADYPGNHAVDWRSIIGPPRILQPAPTVEAPLDVDQLGRVEALKAARAVLQTSAGVFGGTNVTSHSVDDLVRIARFITTGQDPK